MHAFLTSRLDYCNILLSGIPDYQLNHIQRFQNTAARLITRTSKYDHITPVLEALHWLPVRQRISYKVLLFTYKIIYNLAPQYLSDLITERKTTRSLRSSNTTVLTKPMTNTQSYGGRSFSFMAPSLWNSLPPHIKSCQNYETFKKKIKTHLFKEAFKK